MTTKERILNITLEELSRNGRNGFRMQNIAEKAGIKTPSIYAFFKSKSDLIEETLAYAERSITQKELNINLNEGLKDIIFHLFEYYINEFTLPPLSFYYITLSREAFFDKELKAKYQSLLYSIDTQCAFILAEKLSSEDDEKRDGLSQTISSLLSPLLFIAITEGKESALWEAERIATFAAGEEA